jgi:MarR family transcriptional regulator, organic hydroperoxide resistance regulator
MPLKLTLNFHHDIVSKLNTLGSEGILMKDTVDCDIRESLDKIASRMRRDYSENLRELKLHVGQDRLLGRLWLGDGITQMQLCEHLKCEPPTVTNMVKSLEQNGFIYRKRDEQDARVMRIYLTDKGRELEQPVDFKWKQQQEKLLHTILPEERLILRDLMRRMEKNLF